MLRVKYAVPTSDFGLRLTLTDGEVVDRSLGGVYLSLADRRAR